MCKYFFTKLVGMHPLCRVLHAVKVIMKYVILEINLVFLGAVASTSATASTTTKEPN
jgi:hypothetical protein